MKFWYKADWTNFSSSKNVSTGRANPQQPQVTKVMQYIEDRQGHVMDDHSINMMRILAQSIWLELGINGAVSMEWAQVDLESKKGYYRAMAAGFFALRLCNSDWKTEQIVIDNYPLWLLRWRKDTGPEGTGHQHKHVCNTSSMAGPSKKSKGKSKVSVSTSYFSPKHTHTSDTQAAESGR